MEDCSPKPSPEPVLLALKGLGVADAARAIMVGDTVDDVAAAVAAGAQAVGVLTPQEFAKAVVTQKPSVVADALRAAGASIVLDPGLAQLLDLVPVPAVGGGAITSGASRQANISRVTKETSISVKLTLDGTGKSKVRLPTSMLCRGEWEVSNGTDR